MQHKNLILPQQNDNLSCSNLPEMTRRSNGREPCNYNTVITSLAAFKQISTIQLVEKSCLFPKAHLTDVRENKADSYRNHVCPWKKTCMWFGWFFFFGETEVKSSGHHLDSWVISCYNMLHQLSFKLSGGYDPLQFPQPQIRAFPPERSGGWPRTQVRETEPVVLPAWDVTWKPKREIWLRWYSCWNWRF